MDEAGTSPIYGFTVRTLDGQPHDLAQYRGRVLLIVNTASKCGFTPQYEGLEALWRQHGQDGLTVLGFPCNQFAGQEPGDAAAIAGFCSLTHGVSFPMMEKVAVNGGAASPLYRWLKHQKPGLLGLEAIKWNFTKFLVGRDGAVLERFAPATKPEVLEPSVRAALSNT